MKLTAKQNWLLTLMSLTLFFTMPVKAQVTIGDQTRPQDFSILELIAKNNGGGLRLPQLTETQRDALSAAWKITPEIAAEGLVIYNLTINCLEYWNGDKWVSLCASIPIDCNKVIYPTLNSSYNFAAPATIADLVVATGGNVYDAEIDGNLYNDSDPLSSGDYYIEQKFGDCPSRRVLVEVIISTAPVSGIMIDACVSAMYDFQYQTLTAYTTDINSGAATGWQWYVKQGSANYTPISGATGESYFIPAHLYNNGPVDFKVEVWNAMNYSNRSQNTFNIEFIATNGSDGVELRAPVYKNNVTNPTVKLKFSYLNLGAERDLDGTQNACDFGDMYQWGRIADGHEKITWIKPYVGGNITFDAATASNKAGTSGIVHDENPDTALEGGTPFYQVSDQGHISMFITTSSHWNTNKAYYEYYWHAQTPFAKTANDPCPLGWRVPTFYDWNAIFQGSPISGSPAPGTATQNTWTWRPNNGTRIVGGYIITYGVSGDGSLDNTKRIFLPSSGYRNPADGSLAISVNGFGYYWSSTNSIESTMKANGARAFFYSASVNLNDRNTSNSVKATGISVRCVENPAP